MKILHRYILRELFYYFSFILAIFCSVLIAKEIYDTRDIILDESPSVAYIVQYVLLSIPGPLTDALPLVALFSVLFAIGMMARHREITAMVAAGVTFMQLSLPVFIFGGIVTLGSFLFSETVVPTALSQARFIFEVKIKGENLYAFSSKDEIFRKGQGGRFYIMANFDGDQKVMTRPIILDRNTEGGGLSQRIEADRAVYVPAGSEGEACWEFQGAERWTFEADGSVRSERFTVPLRMKLEEKLDRFLSPEKKLEEMRISELNEYASVLQNQGNNSRLPRYEAAVHSRMSSPVACLLLGLMAFAVSVDLHVRRFVLAFTIGLLLGVIYYLLRDWLLGLGQRGEILPALGAWTPVTLYALLVTYLMRRLTTVH